MLVCLCCLGIACLGLLTTGVVWWIRMEQEEKVDAAILDGLIATGGIDRVEIYTDILTNVLTGAEAHRFILLPSVTNRIPTSGRKSYVLRDVNLMRGTNHLGYVGELGHDFWQFRSYCFKFKTPP